jgi:RES domain-containing protein
MPKFSHYQGMVYRAHDPRWAFDPASGEGAKHKGGRFNSKGTKALYTSNTFEGAWDEAQLGFPNKPQPLTLCTYEVDCSDLIDLTCHLTRQALNITLGDINGNWLLKEKNRRIPKPQQIALTLIQLGAVGIIVPSFSRTARPNNANLVFWDWCEVKPHQIIVIDDNGRLPNDQRSWS